MKPFLYLIPTYLGEENTFTETFPIYHQEILKQITLFVVENEKAARKFIKWANPNISQQEIEIFPQNKHADFPWEGLEKIIHNHEHIGLMSDAGLPAVADPGNQVVLMAHQLGMKVKPLVGPSSIFLALMASGLNGQDFHFHGYLPIDEKERKQELRTLENQSKNRGTAHLFIETPYRNVQFLEQLCNTLQPNTLLCLAISLTNQDEFICTLPIRDWKKRKVDFYKKPTLFIFQA